MRVQTTDDGKFQVTDDGGHYIAGPFETHAAAWKFADDLVGEGGIPKRKKPPKLNGSWPSKEAAKAKQQRRKSAKKISEEENRLRINAATAPGWLRDIAAVKHDPMAKRAFKVRQLGTFGPASEVRHIDPAEYLASKGGAG